MRSPGRLVEARHRIGSTMLLWLKTPLESLPCDRAIEMPGFWNAPTHHPNVPRAIGAKPLSDNQSGIRLTAFGSLGACDYRLRCSVRSGPGESLVHLLPFGWFPTGSICA